MSRISRFLAATAMAFCVACTSQDRFNGTDVSGVTWGGDFELTAHTGKRVKSSDFRGKILVLFFGYTHCPDICAPTLVKLAQAQRALKDDAEAVQVLFVTVDARHDTPAQLAGFVPSFHPSFVGLTGTEAELGAVAKMYNVPFERAANQPNQVNHSGTVFVKDGAGRMRLVVKNEASVDDIASDLRLLLKQR
jgi:protein SCO1/2